MSDQTTMTDRDRIDELAENLVDRVSAAQPDWHTLARDADHLARLLRDQAARRAA